MDDKDEGIMETIISFKAVVDGTEEVLVKCEPSRTLLLLALFAEENQDCDSAVDVVVAGGGDARRVVHRLFRSGDTSITPIAIPTCSMGSGITGDGRGTNTGVECNG